MKQLIIAIALIHSILLVQAQGMLAPSASRSGTWQGVGAAGLVQRITPAAVPKSAQFNFSKTSHGCTGWTNLYGDPKTNVLTITDASSSFTLTTIDTANHTSLGFDANGTESGTFFSDCSGTVNAVMYNGFVCTALYDHTKPQLQIGGLNTAKTYTIKLTGSTTGGVSRVSAIYVEGTTLSAMQSYTSHNNTANGVTFTGVAPDSGGKIRIWYNKDATNLEQANVSAFTIQEN